MSFFDPDIDSFASEDFVGNSGIDYAPQDVEPDDDEGDEASEVQ